MMHRNKSVDVHQFAMVPRAEIPRASFNIQKTHKTTFDSGYLIPVLVEEVLPGDTFNVRMTAFARLATPIFPVMDNLHLDSFFFFVPNRLVWSNWKSSAVSRTTQATPPTTSFRPSPARPMATLSIPCRTTSGCPPSECSRPPRQSSTAPCRSVLTT